MKIDTSNWIRFQPRDMPTEEVLKEFPPVMPQCLLESGYFMNYLLTPDGSHDVERRDGQPLVIVADPSEFFGASMGKIADYARENPRVHLANIQHENFRVMSYQGYVRWADELGSQLASLA